MINRTGTNRMININQPSGWVCPVCGRANAPNVKECNHMPTVTISGGVCFLGDNTTPIAQSDCEVHTKTMKEN